MQWNEYFNFLSFRFAIPDKRNLQSKFFKLEGSLITSNFVAQWRSFRNE